MSLQDHELSRIGRGHPPEISSVEGSELTHRRGLSTVDVKGIINGAAPKPEIGHALESIEVVRSVECDDLLCVVRHVFLNETTRLPGCNLRTE